MVVLIEWIRSYSVIILLKFNSYICSKLWMYRLIKSWVHIFFFFFLTCPYKRKGEEIRTSDLRFMKRGPQLIELPLGDEYISEPSY
jgi:hypothetical protein